MVSWVFRGLLVVKVKGEDGEEGGVAARGRAYVAIAALVGLVECLDSGDDGRLTWSSDMGAAIFAVSRKDQSLRAAAGWW